MRQIFEKRYTPEGVRAFEIDSETYAIVAPTEYFVTDSFVTLLDKLLESGIDEEHLYGLPVDKQLAIWNNRVREEVIL